MYDFPLIVRYESKLNLKAVIKEFTLKKNEYMLGRGRRQDVCWGGGGGVEGICIDLWATTVSCQERALLTGAIFTFRILMGKYREGQMEMYACLCKSGKSVLA